MILFGFGQTTIIVTVVLFAIWIIVLDTRAGVRDVSPSLIEMARSFGATPAQLYGKILILAALPEILTGIRLGVIRGVKGVVIGQLLVSIIGLGELFELYSRSFLLEQFWALTLILFAFAILLAEARGRARATGGVLRRIAGLSPGPGRTKRRRRTWIDPPREHRKLRRAGTAAGDRAGRGRGGPLPRPPRLLRRPQLRRARPRDGPRPRPRGAVLLPQGAGCAGAGRPVPLPAQDQGRAPRGRAGGGARVGRRATSRSSAPRTASTATLSGST